MEKSTIDSALSISSEFDKFSQAFCEAQKEFENPTKDSNNPFFNSKYADLANVISKVKEILNKNGLWFTQHPSLDAGQVYVRTVIFHVSGQFMSSICSAPLTKKMVKGVEKEADAQSVGSCITYLRRYSLAAICGIAQEDDDGNEASHNENGKLTHAKSFKPVYGKSSITPNFESFEGVAFAHEDGKKKTIDEIFEGDNIPDWGAPKKEETIKEKKVIVFSDDFMKAEKPETIFPKEIADAVKVPEFANMKITEIETEKLHELSIKVEEAEIKSKNSKNKVILNFIHELISSELGARNQ